MDSLVLKENYFIRHKIFQMEDAERILKKTFNKFIIDNGINPNVVEYAVQFHFDKPHYFHLYLRMHQTKATTYDHKKNKDVARSRDKFKISSIDNWKERIDLELKKERKILK